MKVKTFENLIRKVVREEIDYALGRELKSLREDLRNEAKPLVVEQTPQSPSIEEPVVKNSLKEKIMGAKPFQNRHFSQDSTLNDLLNETAQGDTNLERGQSPLEEINMQGASQAVTEAVTRDYSGLMKAINDKKRP
jgi:hypothetical protein